MTKTRAFLFIAASLAVGLFLSACAGATASRFEAGSQPVIGGPVVQAWQVMASTEGAQADSEQISQTQVSMWGSLHKFSQTHRVAQTAIQSYVPYGGNCHLGDD